ncbi:MAG: hypothetical protein COA98_08125, partial [Candidatus Neomarinimicrobiota bacterium]
MREVVIIDAVRSPIGRYGGVLASVRPDDLLAHVLKALVERTGVDPALVEDVYAGCGNQAGEDNRDVARMALLLAGFPVEVSGVTVNRNCSSGLEAVNQAAKAIIAGEGEIFIGSGVESMSRAPFLMAKSEKAYGRQVTVFDSTLGSRFSNPRATAQYGDHAMPETADHIAVDLGMPEMGVFHFTPIVLIAAVVALPFIWIVMPRMLGDNRIETVHAQRLFEARLRVTENSVLNGRELSELSTRLPAGIEFHDVPVGLLRPQHRLRMTGTHEAIEEAMATLRGDAA